MWGKGQTMAVNKSGYTTLIAKDTEVVGDVKFSGDLEIQGVVKGNVLAQNEDSATVRVVEGGRVEGDIRAPVVVINGQITGDVHASRHVELAAKAEVQGNVHYQLIEMVKGAQLNGNLVYAGAAKPPRTDPKVSALRQDAKPD